jgi:hypothetical protein
MKDRSSTFRIALAAITATAVLLSASWSASAQNASTPNASPTTANPSGVFPGPGTPGTTTFTPASGGAATSQNLTLSYGVGEVVKMYQGGINKDVIINYINNTSFAYKLTADGIIYLQSLGMPQEITKAMILRLEHGVANVLRHIQRVAESSGWPAWPLLNALQEIGHLMDERVLVADLQARHPPMLHVGLVAVGHMHENASRAPGLRRGDRSIAAGADRAGPTRWRRARR